MNKLNSRVATILRLAEAAPPKIIVQTINGLLAILRKKGIAIVDFEDRERIVHRFQIFTTTAYLLATKPTPREEHENGDHGHE